MNKIFALLGLAMLLLAVSLSASQANAQGQYEGWDLVLKDHCGHIIYMNCQGPGENGDLVYEGKVVIQVYDRVIEGEAYAGQITFSDGDLEAFFAIETTYQIGHGPRARRADAYHMTWTGGNTMTGLYWSSLWGFEEDQIVEIVHGSPQ